MTDVNIDEELLLSPEKAWSRLVLLFSPGFGFEVHYYVFSHIFMKLRFSLDSKDFLSKFQEFQHQYATRRPPEISVFEIRTNQQYRPRDLRSDRDRMKT